ncbi:MAG: cell division protein FtsW [Verrucomicrobia bacterium]|jgi:cell division protein FtsW|nr:cell division protein FtsW [Verrucomicrobiota bacterium]
MSDLDAKSYSVKQAAYLLILCVALLLTFGSVMLYSASMHKEGAFLLFKHIVWVAMGFGGALYLAWKDYAWVKRNAPWIFLIAIVLLALIFVFGSVRNHARRWFVFKNIVSFQPSELAKIAMIVFLAWYGEKYADKMKSWSFGFLYPLIPIGVMLGLIFNEPDRGTTILIGSLAAVLLLLAGSRWSGFLMLVAIGIGGLVIIFSTQETPGNRLMAWLDPEKYKQDHAYQIWQSLLAFGSGGLEGLGLGNGRLKINYLPEQQTDFIFAVIGEELGVFVSIAVIAVFAVLVACGLFIAWNARDRFGFLAAAGITFLIGMQALINMAVVTNTLPNKGLSLPFISYGGSNLLFMMAGIGLLISIANHSVQSMGRRGPAPVESQDLLRA